MAEGLVGLRHLVRVFASLDSRAKAVHRVHELCREFLAHALAAALPSRLDEPANAERKTPIAPNLHRDLVGGTADTAGLDLDDRRCVAHCRLQDLEARSMGLRL